MKFAHRYKLKKDLPTYKTGWTFGWNANVEKFYPYLPSTYSFDKGKESIYTDKEHQGYTLTEIKNEEWFEPASKEVEFIPSFPSITDLEEYVDLDPDTRLVNDVDFCRAFNSMKKSESFQQKLYDFFKNEYNVFYKLKDNII